MMVEKKRKKKKNAITSDDVLPITEPIMCLSNCSNSIIQVILPSSESQHVKKKTDEIPTDEVPHSINIETLSMSNCLKCAVQIGSFIGNEYNVNNTSLMKFDLSGDSSMKTTTNRRFKFLLMSSWNRDHVRCWIMNINLPSYVANQFYQEHVDGLMLKIYKKKHLKRDFHLYTSNWRLILYLRKKWLKIEKVPQITSLYSRPENISVPASFTYDMVIANDNIKDIILHLNSKLRSFQDSFTEFNISELNYLHRGDLRVTSKNFESEFVEILNTGKNNLIVGFINVTQCTLCDNLIVQLSEMLRKVKETDLKSFILGKFNLHNSSRKLLLYEKNIIGALTDNLFFRLRTESVFIGTSILFDEVITNDTRVFSYDDGS
ncbi:uncharacterized protein [Asterias amurensis]|uniref:uncharacterized protein n=1 Tax=Asterias amurensis TaxID=7602 RepID=UPI003AB5C035